MSKVTAKHHYIPQFILRNFSVNDKNEVCYYDLKTKQIIFTKTSDVFEIPNFYVDKINYPDIPEKIEKDFAKYESEMALLINGKFLKEDEFELTKEQEQALKLFFSLMKFRSIYAYEEYKGNPPKEMQEYFYQLQKDGNFVDYWKRNLGYSVNCRSIDEVVKNQNIDDPFKRVLSRQTSSIFDTFFVVCEKRGNSSFIIGDMYPASLVLPTNLDPYTIIFQSYPISPSRILFIVTYGVANNVEQRYLPFNKKILKFPFYDSDNNVHIKVQRIYEKDVENINEFIIKRSQQGYIFKNS